MRKEIIIGVVFLIILSLFFVLSPLNKKSVTSNVIKEDLNDIEIIYNSLYPQAKALYYKQSEGLTKEVPERIVELDELTIGCFGTNSIMQMSESDTNLGGQCCGALRNVEDYNLQLKALEEFIRQNDNINLIPRDPYDIPVEHAQRLIQLDKDIKLSTLQERMFNTAVEISHHGGPCCCKCWKWYMMSGLAKKLIVDYNWNAEQLAELWDTSSSCGHKEDTNIFQHYNLDHMEAR